jgi:outer membrane protein assembly factor BamB
MTINDKVKLSKNVAIIAGIFSITVALLLLLNFWQMSTNDPIESKALAALVERLKQEPNNDELKTEIRNFDLLARKAYFNSQWQVKTGAWMLLFGALALAFALRSYYSLKAKIEEPDTVVENEITSRILAQKGIIIAGGVVLLFALGASFLTVNHLNEYDSAKQVAENTKTPEEQGIEVIDVGSTSQQVTNKVSDDTPAAVNEPVETTKKEQVQPQPADEPAKKPEPVAKQTPVAQPVVSGSGLTLEEVKKNHNSFRGPLGQGVIYHSNIPTKWDGEAGTNICWKSPIPEKGFNSPIIWGDKIFIAGSDGKTEEVFCYNRSDGKLLWTGKADNIPGSPTSPPRVSEDTGLSAPTMTTDGKRVFAIFATGDVIAFDMNGKRVWAKNLGVPDNHYGHSSSLLTWANKLIIQYDTNKGGKVIALDVATGNKVWETVRKSKISWASPLLADVDGKYQVVLTADPIVAGYDVETGKELWSVECMMGEVGPSVGYSDGIVVAANEYARMVAIDIRTRKTLWENDEYLPEAASVLAHDGLVIIATSYGVIVCYDLKTGEEYWEDDVGTTLYSSPTYADGKLFMMDNDGVMRVYEFGKEKKLISENNLGEMAGTTPAYMDGHIYIRGENNLYCIGK